MATTKITWSSSQRLRKFAISFLVLATAISFTAPAQASKGGTLAPKTSFSVGYTFQLGGIEQVCSGSLLTPTVIVTAAHCVVDEAGNKSSGYIFAAPGTALDAPIDPSVKHPSVIKVITVPGFVLTDSNEKDDIAFLQLDIPLATKGFIRVATPEEVAALSDKSPLSGYGFGDVYETNEPYSAFTRTYPVLWNSAPSATNTIQISSLNATACSGDSGGPITAKLASGEEVLVAAMSGAAAVVNRCGTAINGNYTMRVTVIHPYLNLATEILKTSAPVVNSYKITCVKGKVKKFVTGTKPKCPTGYKQTAKVLVNR